MEKQNHSQNRRSFLKSAAAVSAMAVAGSATFLKSCSSNNTSAKAVPFLDKAPEGKTLRIGLVGCGSRGTGALFNFLNSGDGIEIVALADVFEDRLTRCRRELSGKKNIEIADEMCFLGFDAYQELISSDVDVVVLATPPYFRPQHFEAAVRARKHVFMEKPVAVDPVGARAIMASAKMAEQNRLKVGVGTQRHHRRDYVATYQQIKNGGIGDIVAANCYWNQGALWFVNRQPGWNDMEAMLRNWVNWCWLSGDHIVEQHLHNIDVINWFTGKLPTSAVGFGSRHRRKTGDQYDNFSVDFVYEDGMHMHSMCRQIDGCANNVSEFLQGTEGTTNCMNIIRDNDRNVVWEFDYMRDSGQEGVLKVGPYDQEIIDLVAAIRQDTPFNEAEMSAKSALIAIMGRISAYTGKEVTYEEVMNSNLKLGPDIVELGPSDIKATIPVPGV